MINPIFIKGSRRIEIIFRLSRHGLHLTNHYYSHDLKKYKSFFFSKESSDVRAFRKTKVALNSLLRYIITTLLVFNLTVSFCQAKHELDSLTNLLEKVSVDDQKYRLVSDSTIRKYGINSPEFTELIKKMQHEDSVNMLLVGNVLDNFGWLSKEQTSEDANDAFFLVIQHATLKSQLKYLPLMKQAVKDKKAKPSDYALLVDRTNMYQGKLQVYGSQLNYDAFGKLHIFPIEDEPNLNKRRISVGLPPMQDYLN